MGRRGDAKKTGREGHSYKDKYRRDPDRDPVHTVLRAYSDWMLSYTPIATGQAAPRLAEYSFSST